MRYTREMQEVDSKTESAMRFKKTLDTLSKLELTAKNIELIDHLLSKLDSEITFYKRGDH